MLDINSTNSDRGCSLATWTLLSISQYTNSISTKAISPDNSRGLSTVVSDMKKLNEEIRAIVQLKSELRLSHDRLSQVTGELQRPAKCPDTSGNKSTFDLIRSDIEKLDDDMNDIRILKSERALYQSRMSRKISALKMKEI